jgi:hypothetical protein
MLRALLLKFARWVRCVCVCVQHLAGAEEKKKKKIANVFARALAPVCAAVRVWDTAAHPLPYLLPLVLTALVLAPPSCPRARLRALSLVGPYQYIHLCSSYFLCSNLALTGLESRLCGTGLCFFLVGSEDRVTSRSLSLSRSSSLSLSPLHSFLSDPL